MDRFPKGLTLDTRPAVPIIRWTIFSIIVSVGFVEIMGRTVAAGGPVIWNVVLGLAWVLALVVPLIAVGSAIKYSFTPQAPARQIAVIFASYIGLIISFGGAYYSMAALADRLDARKQHEYYSEQANYTDPAGNRVQRVSSRALNGIDRRLWSSVDWPSYKRNYLRDEQRTPVPFQDMVKSAHKPLDQISRFQYNARLNVLGNSLYFSAVTMTTLGYGDITPHSWFAKTAAILQVICGLTLFYFGISMVISGWWEEPGS